MAKNIPWWEPSIGKEEYEKVRQVLDSNFLNDGEVTSEFEKRVAQLLGCRYAVAVTSGTTALYLALAALDIGAGDEVIVPDVTFIATANAVTLSGAKPVLADVDPDTLNLSPEALERSITSKTKAVIPVHVSGRPAAMDRISEIGKTRGLHVVEDAAEGLLSRYQGQYLGTMGVAGILSFSPNKTITTGQGGMVLTDDESLHNRLRELKDQGRPVRGTGGDDFHARIGYNFKLTNLQAAVGMGQLSQLKDRIEKMKQTYTLYDQFLGAVDEVTLFPFNIKEGQVPQWVDARVKDRDGFTKYLADHQMDCRKFWHPLHTQPPYKSDDRKFPNSTQVIPQSLWLPSAFTLTEEDIARVCKRIKAFFK